MGARRRTRLGVIAVLCVALLGCDALPSDDTYSSGKSTNGITAESEEGLAGGVRSRHVGPGYEGPAYPVPTEPTPGAHVNDVEVELIDRAGRSVGQDHIPAGTAVEITTPRSLPGTVEFDWDGEFRARAQASEFWVVPDFVDFRDVEVPIDGELRPVGDSDLLYHHGRRGGFDDNSTPEFDAIANKIRRFLSCELERFTMASQYFAVDLVADGIYRDDPALVADGVAAIDWGVARELDEEGAFWLYRECDDSNIRDWNDTHHSTQWLAALGRGIYQLAASRFAGEHRAAIDRYIAHAEELTTHLTRASVRDHWMTERLLDNRDRPYTHKYYMRAAALALTASLTENREEADRWALEAQMISEIGVDGQWPNGVNPEKGGFDVRYQLYGTWLGVVYHSTLVDGAHKQQIRERIERAITWVDGMIDDETGAVDLEGSTRSCQANSSPNEFEPYHLLSVYLLWAHTQPDHEWLTERAVLADRGHKETGNRCPEIVDS